MTPIWRRLQAAPVWLRWPAKWTLLAVVVFLVLYPRPALFVRHVAHIRRLDTLPDLNEPGLAPVLERFATHLAEAGASDDDTAALLSLVEGFVGREIRYHFDWEVWGVADYVPTLGEVIARGTEDCDGRAVLATALLRAYGIDARLVGDARHMWVQTPAGATMNPLGEPAFKADSQGLTVRWRPLLSLGSVAVGVSLFPFARELIILMTVWLLLLPAVFDWKRAAVAAFLLVEGLVVVRLAGSDVVEPSAHGAFWGGLHVLAAAVVLRRSRARAR